MIENKILISLIGTCEVAPTSYELIRLLTRRFNIYNFLDVINNGRENDLMYKIDFPSKQIGSYELTEKGLTELKNINILKFEKELFESYPNEGQFINIVIDKLKQMQVSK